MAKMQIVINISEESYKNIKEQVDKRDYPDMQIGRAITDGIPLPKGHGRLIDSDLLDTRLNFILNHTGGYKNTPIGTGIVIAMAENLDAKTIVDADKEWTDGNAAERGE